MSAYMQPLYSASIAFVLLGFVLWIPWMIHTYRKHGFFSLSQTLLSFSFIFYMISALFLVLLPLPDTRNTCAMQNPNTQHYSLMPFRFIADTLSGGWFDIKRPATYMLVFKQPAFYQAFFNFILLMPLGVYLRYFLTHKKLWWKAAIIAFFVTLFYEVTQITGIYGIYNCAYRIFDVDDLMLNTMGGILGFFLAPAALAIFPSKERIDARAKYLLERDEVKAMSVLLAIAIDIFLVDIIRQIILHFTNQNEVTSFIVFSVVSFLWMCVVPILWNGRTVGTAIMRFRYDSKLSKKTTISRLIKRYAAFYMAYFTLAIVGVLNNVEVTMASPYYKASVFLAFGSAVLTAILMVVLFIHIMLVVFGKGKRRFFFDESADLYTTRKK